MILLCCARCGHRAGAGPGANGSEHPAHAPAPDFEQPVSDLAEDKRLPSQPDAGGRPDTFRAPTPRCRARRRVRGVPSELSILRRRSLAHLETINTQRSIQHRHGPLERSLGRGRVTAGSVSWRDQQPRAAREIAGGVGSARTELQKGKGHLGRLVRGDQVFGIRYPNISRKASPLGRNICAV